MVWMPSVPGEGLPNPGLSSAGDLRSEGGGGGMSRHLTVLLWRQQHWNQAACLKYFLLPFINTQHMAVHLRIQASELYTVLVVNVCHKKTKTTNELIWLSCSVCATVAHTMFFYTEYHWCPKTHQWNTLSLPFFCFSATGIHSLNWEFQTNFTLWATYKLLLPDVGWISETTW